MLWLIPEEGTKLEMMSLLYWQLANGKSVEREFKAVVDTLIRDQAECSEGRLMLWLIPEEGTKLEMMSLLYWQLANGKSVEREFKAVVDTLIRDQAECSEGRLMLWLIPEEGTKLERMSLLYWQLANGKSVE